MSVFPRRAAVGDVVVVHANILGRALGRTARHAEVRITVVDPLGAEFELLRQTVLTAPWPAVRPRNGDIETAGGVRKSLSLVVLASMLGPESERQQLLDLLANIQDGTHFYASYRVRSNSPLGRYGVRVEVRSDGQMIRSLTSSDDSFCVDSLDARLLESGEVRLRNFGPEPAPARIAQLDGDGALIRSDLVTIPGAGDIAVSGRTAESTVSIVLFYCEDRHSLIIHEIDERRPTLLRDHSVRLVQREDDVFLVHLDDGRAWQLDAASARAWRAADGLSPLDIADQELDRGLRELSDHGLLIDPWPGDHSAGGA